LAIQFFEGTNVLDSFGVMEVPAEHMMEEAIEFTLPCVIRIVELLQESGGHVSIQCL